MMKHTQWSHTGTNAYRVTLNSILWKSYHNLFAMTLNISNAHSCSYNVSLMCFQVMHPVWLKSCIPVLLHHIFHVVCAYTFIHIHKGKLGNTLLWKPNKTVQFGCIEHPVFIKDQSCCRVESNAKVRSIDSTWLTFIVNLTPTPGKRYLLLKNCFHQIGLWVCLWLYFFIAVEGGAANCE